MTSTVPTIQALSQNFLTTGGVLIFLVGVCTILFAKRGSASQNFEATRRASTTPARMFGYLVSSVIVIAVSFVIAHLYDMGVVPPTLVFAAVALVGIPSILALERHDWFMRAADNGTMGASVGLGFVGAAYSFFVLDVLWYVLKTVA